MQGLKLGKKPISLKPSPSASNHQLSYNVFMRQKMKQQIKISEHEQLLKQIEDLHTEIYSRQAAIKQLKQNHLKQILMLKIQLEHQLQITSRYDSELRKCQNSRNQLQNYYQVKLQVIKKQMIQNFQIEVAKQRQKTYEDLKQIKQNYCTKISLLDEGNKERQFDFIQRQDKAYNYELKLSLLQTKLQQKQRMINNQTEKLIMLEEANQTKQSEVKRLTRKLQQIDIEYSKNTQSLKQKMKQAESLKQQIYKRFKSMKIEMQNIQKKKQQLEYNNQKLNLDLQSAIRKYNFVQKQLDQMNRNRKTQKNKDEYDKNIMVGRVIKSQRQTERDRERQRQKDKDRDKDKDKQIIIKLTEQTNRLQKQCQFLNKSLQEKDRQINDLSDLVRQKQRVFKILQNQMNEVKKRQSLKKSKNQQFDQQIVHLKESIIKKDNRIRQIQNLLANQAEQFTKKLQYIARKGQQTISRDEDHEKQIKALNQKIQSFYLKQIQSQKKKIQGLELTLEETQQMMVNLAKEKKDLQLQYQQYKQKNPKKK